MQNYVLTILLAPLIGVIVGSCFLGSKSNRSLAGWAAVLAGFTGFLCTLVLYRSGFSGDLVLLDNWIHFASYQLPITLHIDRLAVDVDQWHTSRSGGI